MNTPHIAPPPAPPRGSPRRDRTTSARGAGLRAGVALLRALAAAGAFAAAAAPPARALAEEPRAAGVDLVVDGAPWTLDPDAVRAAVERELGAGVTLARAAAAGRPTLVLRGEPDGRVTLSYSAADGRRIERTIDIPGDPDRAAEAIALLAGNLVRDEAAELAATFGKRAPEAPPAAQPEPAAPPAPPAAVGQAAPAGAARQAQAARSSQPARPAPPEPPRCSAPGAKHVFLGADIAPFVGTSTYDGTNVVRRYSLNLVGGYTAGISGIEVGAGVNIASSFVCGVQLAAGANLALGPARGTQLAAGLNLARSLSGVQFGSINVAAGPVSGAQGGLFNVAVGAVDGAQLGAINFAAGASADLQLGVANAAVSDATDVQLGAINVAVGAATDVQLGLANVAVSKSTDTQLSLINVAAGESTDVQLGLVNVATGKVEGTQIGLVNYADDAQFSFGLLNFIRNGRNHVDVWGTESGIVMAGLKHGSVHIHNIYGVGVRLARDPLLAFSLGLGGRMRLRERAFIDVDLLGYSLLEPSTGNLSAVMGQARALLGYRLSPKLAVFGGPSYNVANGATAEESQLSPYGSKALGEGDTVNPWRGWPGIVLGVEAF
ncbi:LA_2272 family surface repeat-containing protein [Sorangium sp. So ce385]|uniref:LA_2272 family surface repeat-containing protein n=1 Tax=Sorangium sp. So ce385 TaxID=3133308 RepID=UPI003F5BDBE1